MERKLKNWAVLLQGIADGVRDEEREHNLRHVVEVRFWVGNGARAVFYCFSLSAALDAIANDLYWDERGNWAEATRATVEVM